MREKLTVEKRKDASYVSMLLIACRFTLEQVYCSGLPVAAYLKDRNDSNNIIYYINKCNDAHYVTPQ